MEEIKSNSQEISSSENSPLKRIGNFFKEARLSRNQSIEELASNLKIGVQQLKAIEEGDEDLLPEKVFIKAMVRRISQKLKLDTEFIMSEFEIERKAVVREETVEVSSKPNKTKNSNNLKKLIFAILILISGIFGLISSYFIFNLFSDYFQNKIPKEEMIKKLDNF